jgi:hypothetical protein
MKTKMKTVFESYSQVWPESSRASLKGILSKVGVLKFPEEADQIRSCRNPSQFIVVVKDTSLKDIVGILVLGFEHCVHVDREDFAAELLASALMIVRPEAFVQNPVPFFFTGFVTPAAGLFVEENLTIPFQKTSDKPMVLDRLSEFLAQHSRLNRLADMCLQVGDELISNALFSAPVDQKGVHVYEGKDRRSEIVMVPNRKPIFFACVSETRVVIGCKDQYGSLEKEKLMPHLTGLFQNERAKARESTIGAGLGFKYLTENAASVYVYSESGTQTLVACGFLLKNLRTNLDRHKHLHFSFKV